MTIYLIDASMIIEAKDVYYQFGRFPEYWNWLSHYADSGTLKIPFEIYDEINPNEKDEGFSSWLDASKSKLVLDESIDMNRVRNVLDKGYALNLTDVELKKCDQDAILISYAFGRTDRIIVTDESSKPKALRANRRIPDVCGTLGIESIHWTQLTSTLDFKSAKFRSK